MTSDASASYVKLIRCPSLPKGGGFHIKETGMLVVSRWDVNCRVCSQLGCLDEKLLICSLRYPLVCSKKFTKNARTLITQKSTLEVSLSHNHIGLPAYGFNLNFPASLPSLLHPLPGHWLRLPMRPCKWRK